MEKEYNIIIIGTGTAGRTFADKVSRSVLKLDVIDSGASGGISPPGGCDAKKLFTDIARVTDWSNQLIVKGTGIQSPLKIDWPFLIFKIREKCFIGQQGGGLCCCPSWGQDSVVHGGHSILPKSLSEDPP